MRNKYNGERIDLRLLQFDVQVAEGDATEGAKVGGKKTGLIARISAK